MIEEKPNLDTWYRHAAQAEGFIGFVIKTQRGKEFMTQEQQRNLLGILDKKYDQLWLRLQAMPMPRASQFMEDLKRIATSVAVELGMEVSMNMERLAELIQTGLEP